MIKTIATFLYNMRLRNKMALIFILLVIVSTTISQTLLYRYVSSGIRETANVHSANTLMQVRDYFDEKIRGIINRVYALRTNDTFNSAMLQYLMNEDPQYKALALSQFSNLFGELRYSEPFISSVYLYTPKGSFSDLTLMKGLGTDFKQTALYKHIQSVPEASVYWEARGTDEIYGLADQVVPLVFRFSVSGYNGDIYLVVSLNEKKMLNYLQNIQADAGNNMLIIDKIGGIVNSNDTPIIQRFLKDENNLIQIRSNDSGNLDFQLQTRSYFINYQKTKVAPWILIHIQSDYNLLEKISQFKYFMFWIILICVFVSLVIAFWLSTHISGPLSGLEKTMRQFRLHNFDVRFDYSYQDEVGKLGQSFNFLANEIQDLIGRQHQYILQLQQEKERVKTEQQLKRRAELNVLQSQMTPHFLYNTLDSIRWLAEKNQQDEISRIATSLATFFRTALSKGNEIITVQSELNHVTSYLAIQKIRYGERFSYEIKVEPHIRDFMTVKLLLQPLVENAIYHGIKEMEGPGFIRITGRETETGLLFTVSDNGTGIHPVKLQLIRRRFLNELKDVVEGYGIFNVNDRIQLSFGETFGLQIESEAGKGTSVEVRIPVIRREDEPGNV